MVKEWRVLILLMLKIINTQV